MDPPQSTPKPLSRFNVGPQWSLGSTVSRNRVRTSLGPCSHALHREQAQRQALPGPWDAPAYIVQREEAAVTQRSVGGVHHSFTTATSLDREHAAQQASSTSSTRSTRAPHGTRTSRMLRRPLRADLRLPPRSSPQKRDGLVASRRQQAADRVLQSVVEPAQARCATKQALDEQTTQRSSAQAEVRQATARWLVSTSPAHIESRRLHMLCTRVALQGTPRPPRRRGCLAAASSLLGLRGASVRLGTPRPAPAHHQGRGPASRLHLGASLPPAALPPCRPPRLCLLCVLAVGRGR